MKKLIFLILFLLSLALYVATIRGSLGTPIPKEIEFELNSQGQPFETSQERARYATMLALYHEKSVAIDSFASMATPDLGKLNDHYYSLFPPTVSAFAVPFYILGIYLNATQMTAFSLSTVFALLTMILMMKFALKLHMHWAVAFFVALSFGFATNAWGYSVTLYAHIVSAFFILLGLYLTLFWTKKLIFIRNLLVWLVYGVAVYIDYPNIFIFLPIAVLMTLQGFTLKDDDRKISLGFKLSYVVAPFIFVGMLALYGLYNYHNFGSPLAMSNALPRVQDLKDASKATPERQRNSGQVLKSRNMLEGIRSFTISHDRGILVYSPIVLLFVVGLLYKDTKRRIIHVALLSAPAACFVLYTMFGDPYGGWAYGSRYMIAIFPPLILLAGLGLQQYVKSRIVRIFYSIVFIYSSAISLLAPLTTNVIPPLVEARGLGLDSSYAINIRMLENNQLNSFFYNHVLNGVISGQVYYLIILSVVVVSGLSMIWLAKKNV